jgi:hypothetical protein
MSAAGVHAEIIRDGKAIGPCLLIGQKIPLIHHSDGVPVYLVVEHADGCLVSMPGNRLVKLLAYPSAWPSPGQRGETWVYARHERLQWNAPVPLFDGADA